MNAVVVIDYGMGNLRSIANALKTLGAEVEVSSLPERVAAAERLVLPGVGAFGQSMAELDQRGLREPIAAAVASGRPFLGICLGFQVLFQSSNEHGDHGGLGLVNGHVRGFDAAELVVPHMGWNALQLAQRQHPLLAGLSEGVPMYFVHSYRPIGVDDAVTLTTTPYGGSFVSAVARDNLAGVQFHPEKSGREGLRLLANSRLEALMSELRLFPAIDLRQGKVVRLSQGRFEDMRAYSDDAVAQARAFEDQGAEYLHIVDLDAAKGDGHNRPLIQAMLKAVRLRVQLGGGLDSLTAIHNALDWGVWRAVVGSAALRNPDFVSSGVAKFSDAFAVALDARQGRVQVSGWRAESGHDLGEAGRIMAELGVSTLVVTNIERDGMLSGPDLSQAVALAKETGCRVVVSGGVSSLDDLRALAHASALTRIEGVIVGKALYEGRFSVVDALSALRG